MKTVRDLGQLIKAKYPQYRDMDDVELGKLIKQKYPGSYDDFADLALPTAHLLRETEKLDDLYNSNQGRISSWWQRGKSQKRTGLYAQLHAETTQLLATIEQRTYALERIGRQEQLARATNNNSIEVLRAAQARGVDPETHKLLVFMQAELDRDVILREIDHDHEYRMKQLECQYGLAIRKMELDADVEIKQLEIYGRLTEMKLETQLTVDKHRQIEMIDHEMKEAMAALQRDMVSFKQMLPYQEYDQLHRLLSETNDQYYQLKANANSPGEKAELKRLKGKVETLQTKIQEFS